MAQVGNHNHVHKVSALMRPAIRQLQRPVRSQQCKIAGIAILEHPRVSSLPDCRVRYNERMKTLTITEGRRRLGYWLKKAVQGEDVGFTFEGKIVALRPVEVVSTDYALQEYGLTPGEMAAAEKRIGADIKAGRKRGELTRFTGSKNDFR